MSKEIGKRDLVPDKKPGPLTKKGRKKRKKERIEKHRKIWYKSEFKHRYMI